MSSAILRRLQIDPELTWHRRSWLGSPAWHGLYGVAVPLDLVTGPLQLLAAIVVGVG